MLFLKTLVASVLALSGPVFAGPVGLEVRNNGAVSSGTNGPTPPQLKWLYTAYAYCPADLLKGLLTPAGVRKAIPIIGGNFTGPGINGKFRDLGADWGTVSRPCDDPMRCFEGPNALCSARPVDPFPG